MRIRKFRTTDIPRLRQIHEQEGYGFKFPETRELLARYTVTDDDGRIVGFAGAEKTVQIFGIFDSSWGSPHRRMRAIVKLHKPITKALAEKGYKTAHLWADPKFPRFGERLLGLGWAQALWNCFWKRV